ncbi:hypothetical protein D3C72_1443660 [compost metagenome]
MIQIQQQQRGPRLGTGLQHGAKRAAIGEPGQFIRHGKRRQPKVGAVHLLQQQQHSPGRGQHAEGAQAVFDRGEPPGLEVGLVHHIDGPRDEPHPQAGREEEVGLAGDLGALHDPEHEQQGHHVDGLGQGTYGAQMILHQPVETVGIQTGDQQQGAQQGKEDAAAAGGEGKQSGRVYG